jgi:hypothetical protein
VEVLLVAIGLAGVAAVAKKATDIVTWVSNHEWNPIAKTAVALAVAVGLLLLLASSSLAEKVTVVPANSSLGIAGLTLDRLDKAAVVYVGIMLGCIAAWGVDLFKAIDNTRSSSTGALIGKSTPEG